MHATKHRLYFSLAVNLDENIQHQGAALVVTQCKAVFFSTAKTSILGMKETVIHYSLFYKFNVDQLTHSDL